MGSLFQAALTYASSGTSRFHMPGHKGVGLPYPGFGDIARLDLTEIAGLDSLYTADGVIREAERAYAELYGARDSFLSAGGSTLCIQAMLALALSPGDTLLITRGAHVAAVNSMALLDLHPEWILPDTDHETGLSLPVTPQQVAKGLEAHPQARAVYITSPTFFGAMADIQEIARVCKGFSVPLLVDNAHGAHLSFFSPNRHPMAQGADFCCDSLHKTLPVLTGGALLHMSRGDCEGRAREKLSLFGSTSPSYLIMCSMDGALDYLRTPKAGEEMREAAARLADIKQKARAIGYLISKGEGDPIRLTLSAVPLGYTGEQLGEYLRGQKIEPEYAAGGYCVLMAGPFNSREDFGRLEQALETLPARQPIQKRQLELTLPERVLSVREAVFAPRTTLPVEDVVGKVAGSLVAPCPPGIALVSAGELIDEQTARLLKNYGISQVNVLKW
ncbi:MAG: DegT/DnrJ/EryC1/StrS family aminotransferase [Oscillospiraceae bacterium]|nr:DegT/DnrJ/EryC1/StrS family aminotransferase [Oscillospiraceae bacterium]